MDWRTLASLITPSVEQVPQIVVESCRRIHNYIRNATFNHSSRSSPWRQCCGTFDYLDLCIHYLIALTFLCLSSRSINPVLALNHMHSYLIRFSHPSTIYVTFYPYACYIFDRFKKYALSPFLRHVLDSSISFVSAQECLVSSVASRSCVKTLTPICHPTNVSGTFTRRHFFAHLCSPQL